MALADMTPAPDINAQCPPSCPAHGSPLMRQHAADCPWRPMSTFAAELGESASGVHPGLVRREAEARRRTDAVIDAAVERARAERDMRGPESTEPMPTQSNGGRRVRTTRRA